MSLVKCIDCGKNISENAAACPNCGCPMDKILASINQKKQEETERERERQLQKEENRQKRQERLESIPPKKKKGIIIAIITVLILLTGAGVSYWYFGVKKPRDEAYEKYVQKVKEYNAVVGRYNKDLESYNAEAEKVLSANRELDDHISSAQSVLDKGDKPYKKKTKDKLSETIKQARSSEVDSPESLDAIDEMKEDQNLSSSSVDDIDKASQDVEKIRNEVEDKDATAKSTTFTTPDYSAQISALDKDSKALEDSYAILKQITNPKQKFVMKRISKVGPIVNMAPVTEKNDPNNQLGKKGGYTSTIYLSCKWLSTKSLSGNKLIDEGTDAGGAIEVYRNVEDAKRRDKYLAAWDGSAFTSGYHTVFGTMVLRASRNLPYSKQKKLTKLMIKELTKLSK